MVPTDHEVEIYEYWKAGHTLQEVGDKFGCTREWIRQILNRNFGLTGMDNNAKISKAMLSVYLKNKDAMKIKKIRREERIYKTFGCSEEVLVYINKGKFRQNDGGVAYDYFWQRKNARERGISWDISLPEWWQIWKESGKYPVRGKHVGEYVMSRYGDTGPYSKDNVHICLCTENIREYYEVTRKEEVCRKTREGRERKRSYPLLQATA
jgi:DNA-binding CsgD family transcriptional regulator